MGFSTRYVESDSKGHFTISQVNWGRYRVFAKKESANYPDISWSFYSNDVIQTISIMPNVPTAEIQLHIGPIAAVLAGTVTSAATGAPLSTRFKMSREDSSDKWLSASEPPDYRVLIPSSSDILVEISAPGFKTWKSPIALNLQPGTEMHLNISLEPMQASNLHPSKFLIPKGYIGWIQLEYDVKDAQPVPVEDGEQVFEFGRSGTLRTSSSGPETGAEDEYLYYLDDGSRTQISQDYRAGKGMVWGQYQGSRGGVLTLFGFFIGTEEQYMKFKSQQGHPASISSP